MGLFNFQNEFTVKTFITYEIRSPAELDKLRQVISESDDSELTIEIQVSKQMTDMFMEQFETIDPEQKITYLSLPELQLTHSGWQQFFDKLKGRQALQYLQLKDNNLDYVNDIEALGVYLAADPQLEKLDLCSSDKIGDQTYLKGWHAKQLSDYLKTNNHLIELKYAGWLDAALSSNLHQSILDKLSLNYAGRSKKRQIEDAAKHFVNPQTLADRIHNLDEAFRACILAKGTMSMSNVGSIDRFSYEEFQLRGAFVKAKESPILAEHPDYGKYLNLVKYYRSLHLMFVGLEGLSERQQRASLQDQILLHNLQQDFISGLKGVVKEEDPALRDQQIGELIQKTLPKCEDTINKVKDATTGAALKNFVLILSSVLTAGLSLAIYALATRKSRAESGHFFFKNEALSKPCVESFKASITKLNEQLATERFKATA